LTDLKDTEIANKKHVRFIVSLIAAGLDDEQIIAKCEKDKKFTVTERQITKVRYEKIDAILQMQEETEIKSSQVGLARTAARIIALIKLYNKLAHELYEEGAIWLIRKRSIRNDTGYEIVTEKDFNSSLVREMRLTLDDIAKETGGRIQLAEIKGGAGIKAYVGISPDDWPDAPDKKDVESMLKVSDAEKS